jgi:hypothetical protein
MPLQRDMNEERSARVDHILEVVERDKRLQAITPRKTHVISARVPRASARASALAARSSRKT